MFGKPECDVLQPEPHSGEACNTLSHKGLTNVNIQKGMLFCFVCLFVFVALRPKSTAMVIAGRSVHLTTLFPGQA